MASYIKLVFRYLFQQEQLPQELEAAGANSSAAGANSSAAGAGLEQLAEQQQVRGWSNKCLDLARLFASALAGGAPAADHNHPQQNQTPPSHQNRTKLGTFADFEQLIRRQLALTTTSTNNSSRPLPTSSDVGAKPTLEASGSSLELLECYNQLQLRDYYNGYDIFIGLRIASTLTILFIIFILFVIYKTGCRKGGSSRSQLRLTS